MLLPLVAAVLLTLPATLAGCGGETLTYVDPDYGFSFRYNDSWDLVQAPESELPPESSKSVAVFDPRGSSAGNDLTFDYLSVDIYELEGGQVPTFDEMQEGFEVYFDALRASDDTLRAAVLPSATVINGQAALQVSYVYTAEETKVRCSEYRLVDTNGVVYSLFTQAADENWERDTEIFSDFLDSFTVGTTP